MIKPRGTYRSIDQYIAGFPKQVAAVLQQMRRTIQEAAPDAVEGISYQMPTFKLDGRNLVHFAAFENHIGFYPIPSGIEAFQEELAPYKHGKGSVQFPLGEAVPLDLVRRIVLYRAKENRRGGQK